MRRLVPVATIAALVAAVVLLTTGPAGGSPSSANGRAAVNPHVAMGAHLFVQFACSACHGLQGKGGVSKYVPALQPIHNALTVPALTRIITHGLGESANPKRPYMPVWGAVISKSQVADLVAYIRAGLPKVQYADPVPVPRNQGPAVEGAALYVRYGCINCHGPNGLGGVPNPQSEDKAIPPLAGRTSARSSTPTRRSSRSSARAA